MYNKRQVRRYGRKRVRQWLAFGSYAVAVITLAIVGITSQPIEIHAESSVTCSDQVSTESVECNEYEIAQAIRSESVIGSEPANPYDVPYDMYGVPYQPIQWTMDLSEDDVYYLAKIVKCEAGICNMETKIRCALVVLNRVQSEDFPDSVYDVVTQCYNGVYQFSPVIPGGTWYTLEPDADCYEAVEYAMSMQYDISHGATYFEATGSNSVWHQQALEQVCESDGIRFYVVPEE